MNEKEFREFVEERHKEGYTDEDIVKVLTVMFIQGKLSKAQYLGAIGVLGYYLDKKLADMDDDELRKQPLLSNK